MTQDDSSFASQAVSVERMMEQIRASAEQIEAQLDALSQDVDEMNPSDMLELQFLLNLFSQLNETATDITAAFNDVIRSYMRSLKK